MYRNNYSTYWKFSLWVATALFLLLSLGLGKASAAPKTGTIRAATPVQTHNTYAECLPILSKVTDYAVLRKRISTKFDTRIAKIAELSKKTDSLPEPYKATIQAALKADSDYLAKIKADSANITDAKALQVLYCQGLYKTQVFMFRVPQVNYLKGLSKALARDTKLQEALNAPANNAYKSPFKPTTDERYNNARALLASNITAINAALSQLVAASVDPTTYTNNLVKPSFAETSANYQSAYRQYTEAWALRAVGRGYQPDKTLTLVSIVLKDKDDKVVTSKFGKANKAVVTIDASGNDGTITRTVTRDLAKGTGWQ